MKFQPVNYLLLLLSLALSAETPAADTDTTTAPIAIEADQLELDQRRGTSQYRGNVLLTQGKLQIRADQVTLYSSQQQLQRVEISGNPATLVQQGETEGEALRAEAKQMKYQPQQGVISLSGAAQLWRHGSEFRGEHIRYDLKRQLVKASGNEQGEGRVRVLLQPTPDTPGPEEKP